MNTVPQPLPVLCKNLDKFNKAFPASPVLKPIGGKFNIARHTPPPKIFKKFGKTSCQTLYWVHLSSLVAGNAISWWVVAATPNTEEARVPAVPERLRKRL
jgi:hypothetical protein